MWNKASRAEVAVLQAVCRHLGYEQLTEGHPLPKDMESSISCRTKNWFRCVSHSLQSAYTEVSTHESMAYRGLQNRISGTKLFIFHISVNLRRKL